MNYKSFIYEIGKIMRGVETDAILITSGPLLEHVVNTYPFRNHGNGRLFRIWMDSDPLGERGVYVTYSNDEWEMYVIGMGESDVINFIEERETILKLEAL